MSCRPFCRKSVTSLATFFLFFFLISSVPSADTTTQTTPPTREKQIEDLQKQIETLTKQLNDLKKSSGTPMTTPDGSLNPDWLKVLSWRSIGPATMGGRITAISVFESDPSTFYVATASGGLLKTINNGVTFEHQFDHEATVSIGDVCVAPSDKNIVWVGTGENNPRNSVSYGDGVYKSTDGGKSWKNMGLKKTYQIGKIAVHPKDPNTVYVGAMGRCYGPNEERGLFKTTDGGKNWEKILYIDEKTGVIDIAMSPADPNTLLIATWERQRDEFDSAPGFTPPDGYDGYDPMKKWGPGAGIWKTTDGGKTFKKLTTGLPTCLLGRIGLDYYRKDPNTIFAIIDSEKFGMGPPQAKGPEVYMGIQGEDAETGTRLTAITPGGPADKAGLLTNDIVVGVDNKVVVTYKQLVDQLKTHKPGDQVTIKINRNKEGKEITVMLGTRPGQSGTRPFGARLAGQVENIQDKQGNDGFQYGGVYKSIDGGESWSRINSLNPRPMYFSQIRVDPGDDKNVYVLGVALHRSSDGGKTFKDDGGKTVHADHHALWIDPKDARHMIVGGDGGVYASYDRMNHWDFLNHMALGQFYHVCVDARRPYYVYGGLQDNGSWGGPSRTLRSSGPVNDDWFSVMGGDGFVCRVDPSDPDIVYAEVQNGGMIRRNLKTGSVNPIKPRAEKGAAPYRFNWNTPFILSSHNPSIFYAGGNYVFRSLNRGDDLKPISPEITRSKRGSATALSESPRNPDVLWAGTDDGNLWVSKDGGKQWTNVADKVGLPGPRWVASIEASRFADGRAYVAFDAHRSDDDNPYVYVTEDFGQNWKSLKHNLPIGSTRVLREDIKNPDLLFLGTEFACWASLDRGSNWYKLNNNLPTVALHELAIHPTANEMVAATHGRSLWVLDIAPLRQMTAAVVKAPAHLFEPTAAIYWRSEPSKGSPFGGGNRRFIGENPARAAPIYYSLTRKPEKMSLKIVDVGGKTIRDLQAKNDPGLYKIVWDMRTGSTAPPQGKGPRPGPPPQQQGTGPPANPGTYRVVLSVDGVDYAQTLRVEADPNVPTAVLTPEEPGEKKPGKIDD
jgi:photosystem II stability/assembly factor-like uncharacterized protein